MGWWAHICHHVSGQHVIEARVDRTVGDIRRTVRATYPDPAEAIPIEIKRLKNEIRITYDEGGDVAEREALYMWEVVQRLYPEQITESDKPAPRS